MIITHASRTFKGEDTFAIGEVYIRGKRFTVIVVCDGHGGDEAARVCSHMALPLVTALDIDDPESLCIEVIRRLDAETAHLCAGCTVTLCFVGESSVTCANLGDSHAICALDNRHAVHLTTSHRVSDSPSERDRLIAAGGRVERAQDPSGSPAGVLRIYPGGLAIGRALGDSDCRPHISSEPSVSTLSICSPFAIIVATDGVWDAVTPIRACSLAMRPGDAATRIVNKAWSKQQTDDVTCVVVTSGMESPRRFGLLGMFERSSSSSLSSLNSDEDRTVIRVPLE